MNEAKTMSMLQRVPAILAVTANSYGLELRAQGTRKAHAAGERRPNERNKGEAKPVAHQ
jgi:hypothetical protein